MRYAILGGTGTLGRELVKQILSRNQAPTITIISRDEHKQAAMKRSFPECKFVLGDIRDQHSIKPHLRLVDTVFHVAALKHVDILESNPLECMKTNVLGTEAVARAAIDSGVRHLVFSSTDKAVDPINTYGYSKALSEKILFDFNRNAISATKFSVFRWGNVLGSNGSAIPFFAETLLKERKAYVTHQDMTRYWIPIENAVRFMLDFYQTAELGQAMVPHEMKAARVVDVVRAIAEILSIRDFHFVFIKPRPGEKIHEAMFSQHSDNFETSETADQYTHNELIAMLEPLLIRQFIIPASKDVA